MRSLILAGGGIKVAFQAGALQVWLDEAGLEFDHVDAASGGVFNLAMMCSGLTGTQIADNWRNLNPRVGIELNTKEFAKLLFADGMFSLDGYRHHVFPEWKLDWDAIRSSKVNGTFNVYNFSKHRLEVIEPKDLTEDLLIACVSLPMWFPPVRIGDQIYIDSVYLSDANIEEAIRRGADEIWVIWTVSDKSEWHPGFLATYFQIIETASVGRYREILARIEANNRAIERGQRGEFGRPIQVKELKADVALHYLINLSQDRITETVNLGVQRARAWCERHGIPLETRAAAHKAQASAVETRLSFTEVMKGYATFGASDFDHGHKEGRKNGTPLSCHLTITVDGVDRFVTSPGHEATAAGFIECGELGGRLSVERGTFNLFVDQEDSAVKKMLYRLFFRDRDGNPFTLTGFKLIQDDPGFDLWSDTTTLFTSIFRGHLTEEEEAFKDPTELAELRAASGIIGIPLLGFLHELTTFRVEAPTVADRVSSMNRFGRLFLGKLWDVYARDIVTSGPM